METALDIILSDDQFIERFKPYRNLISHREEMGGFLFETYGEDYEHICRVKETSPDKIWTVLTDDNGYLIVASGFHWVNRFGYFITAVPFELTHNYVVKWEEED